MNRRRFLKTAATATTVLAAGKLSAAEKSLPAPSAAHLPRWRGFNLLEKFFAPGKAFLESDFEWMAEWGFDFARLPLSYHCWADPKDWLKLNEVVLKEVDQAVEFGRQHRVHINVNLHRAPGYCVNPPKEPLDLWNDEAALDACAFHWAHFSKRYKGIPNTQVSFDLLNEPSDIAEEKYVRVVKRLVDAIRAEDPQRLIIADGLKWGTKPVHGLAGLGIAQSTRGYDPSGVSHYKANWVNGADKWPEPTWPLKKSETDIWDKERLRKERIQPWKELEKKGVGIHVGEGGAYQFTPHPVALAWLKDFLELWKAAGWGWALWNFRGSFGLLDSHRVDVKYESFRGHQLDRSMLELLRAH